MHAGVEAVGFAEVDGEAAFFDSGLDGFSDLGTATGLARDRDVGVAAVDTDVNRWGLSALRPWLKPRNHGLAEVARFVLPAV